MTEKTSAFFEENCDSEQESIEKAQGIMERLYELSNECFDKEPLRFRTFFRGIVTIIIYDPQSFEMTRNRYLKTDMNSQEKICEEFPMEDQKLLECAVLNPENNFQIINFHGPRFAAQLSNRTTMYEEDHPKA